MLGRCDTRGEVATLAFVNVTGLRGTLPTSISQVSSLRLLLSVGNMLSGTLGQSWQNTSLEVLGLLDLHDTFNLPSLSGTLPRIGSLKAAVLAGMLIEVRIGII